MIKVKTFIVSSGQMREHKKLDNQINGFIAENNVEVIDIKYTTSAVGNSFDRVSWIPSAMLIYKELDNK